MIIQTDRAMDSKIQAIQSNPLPKNKNLPAMKEQNSIFQISLKKESGLFSSWKSLTMILIESTSHLLAKFKAKKSEKIEESLDLTSCRLSNKIVKIQKYTCFGFILSSNKKYLIAGKNQQQTQEIYNKIHYLRNRIKMQRSAPSKLEQTRKENQQGIEREEREEGENFSFQKSSDERQKSVSPQTPKKRFEEQEQDFSQQRNRDKDNQEELFKTAVLDISPLESEEPQFHEKQLTLSIPITLEEIGCLNSDEGFKLKCNFPEGRILTAREQRIKVNLLVSTHFTDSELLESFFHLQLWNERVKSYSLVNRIDEGIYLVKLELHRKSIISRPRYCYMMASTYKEDGKLILVFRSLQEEQFEAQIGYSWISIDIWVRVQTSETDCKLLTVCSSYKNGKDFEIGLLMLQQLKKYQLFLKTTGSLPRPTLEWRGQKKI